MQAGLLHKGSLLPTHPLGVCWQRTNQYEVINLSLHIFFADTLSKKFSFLNFSSLVVFLAGLVSDWVLHEVSMLDFCQDQCICKGTGSEYQAAGQMWRYKPL